MDLKPFTIIPEDPLKQRLSHEMIERWLSENPEVMALMTESGAELDAIADAHKLRPRDEGETDASYRRKVLAKIAFENPLKALIQGAPPIAAHGAPSIGGTEVDSRASHFASTWHIRAINHL